MLDPMFTLVEALDIIGVLQCVFVLGIIMLRAPDIRRASAVAVLVTALGLGFGLPAPDDPRLTPWGAAASWLVEAYVPALGYILILQVALERLPAARHAAVLALPLLGPPAALALTALGGGCAAVGPCPGFSGFLGIAGVVPGAVVLLLLWLQRNLFGQLRGEHDLGDRYLVAATLIVFNVLDLGVDLARATAIVAPADAAFAGTVFALAFVFLVTALAFRIDPKPVVLIPAGLLSGAPPLRRPIKLTREEHALAKRIGHLMALDKLYQEPTFSRTKLARELDTSEYIVSRVISGAFGKSFRQLLNEHRVNEAKALLVNTDLQVAIIAFDVGFNSLASFNRAFKEITGLPPTEFRATMAAGRRPAAHVDEPGESRTPLAAPAANRTPR